MRAEDVRMRLFSWNVNTLQTYEMLFINTRISPTKSTISFFLVSKLKKNCKKLKNPLIHDTKKIFSDFLIVL